MLRREERVGLPIAVSPPPAAPSQPKQHAASVFVVGNLVRAPAGGSSLGAPQETRGLTYSSLCDVDTGAVARSQEEVRVRNAAVRASESAREQSVFQQGVQELDDMIQEFRGKYKRPVPR